MICDRAYSEDQDTKKNKDKDKNQDDGQRMLVHICSSRCILYPENSENFECRPTMVDIDARTKRSDLGYVSAAACELPDTLS